MFDGFRVLFSFTALGSNNKFLNLKFQGQPFVLNGTNNHAENITITHVLVRDETTFSWFTDGQGTAGGTNSGSGLRVTNLHAYHNWNSSFSSEGATGVVVDGARLHGAPNHCTIAANGNSIIRNAILYNCQDFQWLIDTNRLTLEHVVLPSGIAFSAVTRTLGPVIVRNSIFQGTFHFVRGTGVAATLPFEGCTWEKGSILENNVISANATIERCAESSHVIRFPPIWRSVRAASSPIV